MSKFTLLKLEGVELESSAARLQASIRRTKSLRVAWNLLSPFEMVLGPLQSKTNEPPWSQQTFNFPCKAATGLGLGRLHGRPFPEQVS